ncbi:MAG: inositol monophosphatase [Clostridiales bacterium]|jgi:myo-inositol-1(or 4)-monophosphatase|nr:inositol monophosphatase [Clostridiales bacterium]
MLAISKRTQLAAEVSKQAGVQILEIQKGDMGTRSKGANDVLTIADTTSEKTITDAISSAFPNDGIIAEEGSRKQSQTGYTWVIDPLDGTLNFSRKIPLYAVSVGYLKDGKPKGGAMFIPAVSELFVCERGNGAYLNGGKIKVSNNELADSLSTAEFNNRSVESRNWLNDIHKNLMENTMNVEKLFSTVISLCYVACGRTELHCELECFLWDIMPAGLLIEEAGGKFTQIDGSPVDYSQMQKQCVLGTNGIIHDSALDLIKPKQAPLRSAEQ